MNERQTKVFERLCFYELEDGFKGKFTNQTYQKMAHMSDQNKTATRDLKDLVTKNILQAQGTKGGAHYYLDLNSQITDCPFSSSRYGDSEC